MAAVRIANGQTFARFVRRFLDCGNHHVKDAEATDDLQQIFGRGGFIVGRFSGDSGRDMVVDYSIILLPTPPPA